MTLRRRRFLKFSAATILVSFSVRGSARPAELIEESRRPPPFPRVADIYYGDISHSKVSRLAMYDLLVCGGQDPYTAFYPAIKQVNPNIKILPYMDVFSGGFQSAGGPLVTAGYTNAWQLKTSTGSVLSTGANGPMLNCSDLCPTNASGQQWGGFLAQWVHDNYWAKGFGDGVFFDNCQNTIAWYSSDIDLDNNGDNDLGKNGAGWVDRHWKAGSANLMQATRNLLGSNAIIMGNGPLYSNAWANG